MQEIEQTQERRYSGYPAIEDKQAYLGLRDFRCIKPAFQDTEAGRLLLERYGACEGYEFSSGDIVTILPTCFIPLNYFERESWQSTVTMGHFRGVYSVDNLSNGTKPKIVVKSPERIFTKDRALLDKGYPWWGGSRSSQKRTIYIKNNSIVEEQVLWEAIILLELHRHGFRAELPQALIEGKDGRIELVVNEVEEAENFSPSGERSPSSDLIIKTTGLYPEDYTGSNILTDKQGHAWIIDVNRWTWPPYTDNFRNRLLQVISETKEQL